MDLRRAEERDFEQYKKLFEDEAQKYQWLYDDEESSQSERKLTEDEKYDLQIAKKEYTNYTFERFQKDISTNIIYIIEENSEIIGYVGMYKHGKDAHRIYEWAMFNPEEYETKGAVLNLIKRIPKVHKLIIVTSSARVIEFLKSNGFKENHPQIYEFEINPKRTS